eukprot:NODE_60_length_27201_cov_1.043318.p19 type:complete len:177 gc:universal NODE_60_length_27201_cov_1.043318:11747-11217(-)
MIFRLISFQWIPTFQKYLYHYYSVIFKFYKPVYHIHQYSLTSYDGKYRIIPEEGLYNGYRILQDGFYISGVSYMNYMTNIYFNFSKKYWVYKHYRDKKFLVYSGINFAVDYVLYTCPRDVCHSSYGVLVNPNYTYSDLYRAQRSLHQSRKKLVLCFNDDNEINSVIIQRFTPSGHR